MIRHGAELVHAYCAATVPRLCVVMRKAYGGAYIVDGLSWDRQRLLLAWPTAEIAVMGGPPTVQILYGEGSEPWSRCERVAEQVRLVASTTAFINPYRAAELGLVDAVIDPARPAAFVRRARG